MKEDTKRFIAHATGRFLRVYCGLAGMWVAVHLGLSFFIFGLSNPTLTQMQVLLSAPEVLAESEGLILWSSLLSALPLWLIARAESQKSWTDEGRTR